MLLRDQELRDSPKKDWPNFFKLQSISNLAIRKLGQLF